MRHRTVREVMTRDVVTVNRFASFKDVARQLAEAGVTAVPVVDGFNRLVGIISAGDLLSKESAQPEPHGRADGAWMRPAARDRAVAESAGALMSTRLFTAGADWSVARAARVMDLHQVARLPVVDEQGVLVGIVSRSDLLEVFLRPDQEIHDEIVQGLVESALRLPPDTIRIHVVDGVVAVSGELARQSTAASVLRLCGGVDGVVAVHDRLTYVLDDRTVTAEPTPEPMPEHGSPRRSEQR
jgi:CBS-domain-containing membrane protein